MNDIISTFNDLYYKIQISHNICLADVRNICLKSYNKSVVCVARHAKSEKRKNAE